MRWGLEILLEHPRLVVALLSFLVIFFEIIKHSVLINPFSVHFYREVIIFGLVIPVSVGWLLNECRFIKRQRDIIMYQHQQEEILSKELFSAPTRTEFAKRLLNFLRTMAPFQGIYLFSYSDDDNVLLLKSNWWLLPQKNQPTLPLSIPMDYCGVMMHSLHDGLHLIRPDKQISDPKLHAYCLPLFQCERRVGVLHLYLPASELLRAEDTKFLDQMAPTIAMAHESINMQNRVKAQSIALQDERQRIGRKLHGNLGQNLAYIRTKLDQINENTTVVNLDRLHQDLEQMRQVAHEMYEQMRQILIDLHPDSEKSLTDVLLSQMEVFQENPRIQVKHLITGMTKPIPFNVQRKIHAIVREAINNVLRHSQAKNVTFSLTWTATDLIILLADDGIGFNLDLTSGVGHFGLLIMQQRATEINANLKVVTAPNQGTTITLHYPLESFHLETRLSHP